VGIYDRDYYRQGGSGFRLRAPRTAVVAIILINVAVYVVEIVETSSARGHGRVVELLGTHVDARHPQDDTLTRPWMWWQFLTYGFTHSPADVQHIIFNMLTLFFLGRDVEQWYGTREFIRLYLVMLAFSGLVWAVTTRLLHGDSAPLIGASGAISGVVVLYALLFPKRTLLFMFVLPLPAWLLGAMAIAFDIFGSLGGGNPQVAYVAHLGGAAFALAYFYFHWNLGGIFVPLVAWIKGRRRPSLKVFKPDEGADEAVTDEEVDRILTKIHREGEHSLTAKERRIMENASREYRRRRGSE